LEIFIGSYHFISIQTSYVGTVTIVANLFENPMPQNAVPCYPYYSCSWLSLSHEYSLTLGTACKAVIPSRGSAVPWGTANTP